MLGLQFVFQCEVFLAPNRSPGRLLLTLLKRWVVKLNVGGGRDPVVASAEHESGDFTSSAFPAEDARAETVSPELADEVPWIVGRERLLVVGLEYRNDLSHVVLEEVGTRSAILGQARPNALEEARLDLLEHLADLLRHGLQDAVGVDHPQRVLQLWRHSHHERVAVLHVVVQQSAAVLSELQVLVEEAHLGVVHLQDGLELLLDLDDGGPEKELAFKESRFAGDVVLEVDANLACCLLGRSVHRVLNEWASNNNFLGCPTQQPYMPTPKFTPIAGGILLVVRLISLGANKISLFFSK